MYRIGLGQDSHKFTGGQKRPLILGGIRMSEEGGLAGNSDADVILHSLCNALSSAIGGDSLSSWADEMHLKGGIFDSQKYTERIFEKLTAEKYIVENVSVCVEAKKPYLKQDIIQKIKENIARLLAIRIAAVGITFTSGEGLSDFGKGRGIQSIATALIFRK